MKAATAKINITPPFGTPMGGNVRIDNKSRGIHDDLFCNILILDDSKRKICLLGFDLLGLNYSTCNDIKNEIENVAKMSVQNIVIWTTHTHSGPDTCSLLNKGINELIDEYLDDVIKKVAKGVAEANKNYKEIILKVGKTSVTDLSFNRRLVKFDSSVVMNFEEFNAKDISGTTGPIDKDLISLSIWDKNNTLLALLVNFALHPAVLVGYKWLISRDFIHYLDEYILNQYGSQVVLLFANGAEGNINHLNYKNPIRLRSFEETERIGEKLGSYVCDSLDNSSILNDKIQFISEKITIPFRDITEGEKQWADMVIERDKNLAEDMVDGIPDKTYAKMIKEMLVRPDKEFETVLQGLAIGNFALVTFPGEVYVEFGLQVKELSPFNNTMIIGLANSYSGYIPKKEAFSQGGYEVRTAWSSQLVYNAGDILVDLVKDKVLDPLLKQAGKLKCKP